MIIPLNKNFVRNDFSFEEPFLEYVREGFGKGLLEISNEDTNIVALCADLTDSTKMNYFKEAHSDRFFEIGIGEQNLAGVASGLSAEGFYPFISSYAMFSPGRNWEQIRTTICYNDRPVCIVGSHAGVSVGPDGGTHQALEDIALTRVLPRMNVYVPADIHEAKKITKKIAKERSIAYLRLAREKTPVVSSDKAEFMPFVRVTAFDKDIDFALFVTGTLLFEALKASQLLFEKNITVDVIYVPQIKPFPSLVFHEYVSRFGIQKIFTLEEHQIMGGFGSLVCEEICTREKPIPVIRIGINNVFGQSGEPIELINFFGLDGLSVSEKIREHTIMSQNK